MSEVKTGKIEKYMDERGFGFIEPGGVFVHIKNVENADTLERGQEVEFITVPGRKEGQVEAKEVRVV